MLPGQGDALISTAVTEHYDLLYGSWPTAYNEIVLILDETTKFPLLFCMNWAFACQRISPAAGSAGTGRRDHAGRTFLDLRGYICEKVYYLVPACDYYVENEEGLYAYVGDDEEALADLVENGVQLTITGIIRPSADSNALLMNGYVGYTKALTDYLIDYTNASAVVRAQIDSPEVNVVSGFQFEPEDDAAKIADTKNI